MKLSREAEAFIDNLHLYLLSSGKKDKEINEIVEELTDHLQEAEANGKNIHEVTGESPKEYMESLASEMQTDLKEWGKLLPHVFISLIAYTLIGKIILGENQISLFVAIGSIFIRFFMLGLYVVVFRFVSSRSVSNKKTFGMLFLLQILLTGLFFGLMFYGNNYGPVFMMDTLAKQTIFFIIPFAYICWFAWWSKTWIMFFPVIIYLPMVIVEPLSFSKETKSIISSATLIAIMLGYFIWIIWKGKQQKKTT